MDGITITRPRIEGAVLSQNPVNINTLVRLAVTVIDETIVLEPTYFYSGDLFCGEV